MREHTRNYGDTCVVAGVRAGVSLRRGSGVSRLHTSGAKLTV